MNTNYQTQLKTVKLLFKNDTDTRIRTTCPFCKHDNSFAAFRSNGTIVWHCFHSDCNCKGRHIGKLTKTELIKELDTQKGRSKEQKLEEKTRSFLNTNLDTFVPGKNCFEFQSFLKEYNLNNLSKNIDIRFDPFKHRAVFIMQNECQYKEDAVGVYVPRSGSIIKVKLPKWLRYGQSSLPFYAPHTSLTDKAPELVIVEDPISACVVSKKTNALALLGTHMTERTFYFILGLGVEKLIISLDKNASQKSIEIAKRFSGYLNEISIYLIEKDLKYYHDDEMDYYLKRARKAKGVF